MKRLMGSISATIHHPITAWGILLLSFVITGLAWHVSSTFAHKRASDRFLFQAQDIVSAIQGRMMEYAMVLRAGVGLFNAVQPVSREEWRTFAESLHLNEQYPGIQGYGFSRMFPAAERAAHEAAIRHEGFSDYAVFPTGARDTYSAIVFLEPFNWRNRRAFGYDMYTEPVRRLAMERACDTGEPALSGQVTLVQETTDGIQNGVLMYVPVYRQGMPLRNVAERRAALMGFVYSPFRINDLMAGILGSNQGDLDFDIYDGSPRDPSAFLFSTTGASDHRMPAHKPDFDGAFDIPIAGHRWSLHLYTRHDYLSAIEQAQPTVLAIGGIAIDLLLFLLLRNLSRQYHSKDAYARSSFDLIEQERLRLSHELHDDVGQSLLAVNMALRSMEAGSEGAAAQARQITADILAKVRAIAHRLRPAELDDIGLTAALRRHIDKAVRPAAIDVGLAENLGMRRLPQALEACCFRLVQEALSNVIRHADATSAEVSLMLDAESLTLSVRDDGAGFDMHDIEKKIAQAGALGLIGMRERVQAIGGRFAIRSHPGRGTEVTARFSLTEETP